MPPFYIGSTSVDKIKNGYLGSVCSKKYKKIWEIETKYFKELFDIKIMSYHRTRGEALHDENKIQRKLEVASSEMYINQAYATKNGCFGQTGKNAWNFGKTKYNDESIASQSKKLSGRNKLSPEIVEQIVIQRDQGKVYKEIHQWIIDQGLNDIAWTSLHKIYKREHHKYSTQPMVIGSKGRTKEEFTYLATLSSRMTGKTKYTDDRVKKATETLISTLRRKNETIDN
jgi:hypothetical protein